MKKYILVFSFVLIALLISSFAPNKPWRTNSSPLCDINKCKSCAIEHNGTFDLGFVEFSERGNYFDEKQKKLILDKIKEYSSSPNNNGVTVIVFVHGWKHNASADDENVKSFRRALKVISQKSSDKRKIFGVYVGWRGLSFHGLQMENATFWDRKAVAQEVGKGGVTDLLLELERIDKQNSKNILTVVGHSFGGAIVLSALDEVLLERLIHKKNHPNEKLKYFGDVVVLINPAIEANQAFQLQEVAREIDFNQKNKNGLKDPRKILHVISSEGDLATKYAFRAGQFVGTVLTWNQEIIYRNYKGKQYDIDEYNLDLTTVGNFKPFHTANLIENNKQNKQPVAKSDTKAVHGDIVGDAVRDNWEYKDCCICNKECNLSKDSKYHLPCTESYPISFLYTAKSFINGHNDIFNCNITSYLLATVSEALFYQNKDNTSPKNDKEDFNFTLSFFSHLKEIKTPSSDCERK